ncbi:MAG: ATP-binding cassette domain-containing protein [Bacillales bacterium]|jgi:ABC-2 type transport system ATP-binding protein|nr:ATP-binding cassette domain-containing protein [Bacillales bacterium]
MSVIIDVDNLSKDYGNGRGLFNVSLKVEKGEVFGLVGINGAGKTTLIRHLMGFLKADKGNVTINGKNYWFDSAEIKKDVSYIPGEIAFPSVKTGNEFFKLQAEYLKEKDLLKAHEIADKLHLDARATLKRMSKGMKQKSAIVVAFMEDKEILIFDEPTTGLDPLMQKAFSEMIMQEKAKGKTIFMSSHIFDEMEHTCDKVAVIKEGHILDIIDMNEIRGMEAIKEYKIEFNKKEDYQKFLMKKFEIISTQEAYNQVLVKVSKEKLNKLFEVLSSLDVKFLTYKPLTLRDAFNDIYKKNKEEI